MRLQNMDWCVYYRPTIVDLIHEMTHNGSILQNMDECVYYTIVDFIHVHEMTLNGSILLYNSGPHT